MLHDDIRMDRFQKAIRSCVKPGDAVLDLGSGTGVLAVMAVEAGARVVYAVEATEIVEIARNIAQQNGVEGQIVFLDDFSQRVRLPEAADVLITETVGNFGLNEGILGWTLDARRRFLKPEAVIIPRSIELFAAPVCLPETYAREINWEYHRSGIDFGPMRSFGVNNLYAERIQPEHLMSNPISLGEIRLAEIDSTSFKSDVRFEISKSGDVHGLGGWFFSQLCEGVSISNAPYEPPSSWNQTFLPLRHHVRVKPGDTMQVMISSSNNGSVWRWQLEVSGESKSDKRQGVQSIRFDHSTFYGSPSMPSHLHRHAAGHVPSLNSDGRLMRFILGHMEGVRTLEELAVLVAEEFPGRFSEPAEALEHVRTISAEFGE